MGEAARGAGAGAGTRGCTRRGTRARKQRPGPWVGGRYDAGGAWPVCARAAPPAHPPTHLLQLHSARVHLHPSTHLVQGETYYFKESTNETSWEKPTVAQVAAPVVAQVAAPAPVPAPAPGLPEGWSAVKTDEGEV